MWRDQLARVLSPEYLGDLGSRPLDDLRAMRLECKAVGDDLSFIRRQVHGRLDIVNWELEHRAAGGERSTAEDLVRKLDDILSANVHAPGHKHMVDNVAPPDLEELTEEIDALIPPIWALIELDDPDLRSWAERLGHLDDEYSKPRREVFDREDAIKAAITDRFGDEQEAASG